MPSTHMRTCSLFILLTACAATPSLLQDGMPYNLAVNHMRLAHTDSGIVVAPRGECECTDKDHCHCSRRQALPGCGALVLSAVCRRLEA